MKLRSTVNILTTSKAIIFIIFLIIILASKSTYSYPTGVSGYTKKSGTVGCGNCHGSSNTSVKVEITGPASLKTGETGTYAVTISGGAGSAVGVDIASSNGTLVNADNNLKVLNGELTQPGKKAFSGGKYVFNFKYTAPSSIGTQTLYATGVSSKPDWNFAPNFAVNIVNTTEVTEGKSQMVGTYSLSQNYPNPFNPSTKISYSLPVASVVKLIIYNSIGQNIATLVDGFQGPGNHEINFNGSKLSAGIYLYSIEAKPVDGGESFKFIRKMSLLK
ncbi:MAG: choice-of-anchor V domain-containing protein [Clostridiales bacterium]